MDKTMPDCMWSAPEARGPVWVLADPAHPAPIARTDAAAAAAECPECDHRGHRRGLNPGAPAGFELLTPERRRELLERLRGGELARLVFRAVTFRAVYPNQNYLRFRETDLPAFAGSFTGVPFLRDHNVQEIEARGGTVIGSLLDDQAFLQTIELTVPRDIEAFLHGQIDRFSISWTYTGVTCSVCGQDWLSSACPHWPGRRYKVRGEGGREQEALCELIFEGPRGKEVSAVNAPAVSGTGVREVLAQLRTVKEREVAQMADCDPNVEGEAVAPTCANAHQVNAAEAADSLAEARELLEAQRAVVLGARLAGSGLPAEMQEVVRGGLPPRWGLAELDQAVARAVAAWARLEEQRTVQHMAPRPGQGRASGMLDSLDQVGLALEGLLLGRRPEHGVRPLSGIREFYVLMSGDYEMHGMFHPENVGLAAVDSSTMAGLVANAMNKVIVQQFQQYPRWWEPLCTIEDFGTLQQVRWITLGGVGELPTVAEGAAYTEMTWDDQTETSDWVKKGGYLGLTLEAIDKDDTRRIQQAGPALARAAWLSLGKSVARIFTAPPTLSDGVALFHGNHGNLGNTALSYAGWDATRVAMRKQTELNSGERLGGIVVPRYLLVPPDLEGTAVQVLATEQEPGQANYNENVHARGDGHDVRLANARRHVIVVDFWTDATDWAAVADPNLYPSIGLGFRFGRQPEVFSVASPTSGLLFTNDTMPIKVRFFFAVGPTDWRGLYKHVVAN